MWNNKSNESSTEPGGNYERNASFRESATTVYSGYLSNRHEYRGVGDT